MGKQISEEARQRLIKLMAEVFTKPEPSSKEKGA